MDDPFFNNANQSAQLFDLSLCQSSPIGFSPSIEGINTLPISFDDSLQAPTFINELQRRRADTITAYRPASFKLQLDAENQMLDIKRPSRPHHQHRLSLTPSVDSSAASTTTSEFDYSGCDSEADSVAPSPALDGCPSPWENSPFYNMAVAHRFPSQAEDPSCPFSFTDFIQAPSLDDDEEEDEDSLASRMSTLRPSAYSPMSPFAQQNAGHSGLGIFGVFDNSPLAMPTYQGQAMVLSQSGPQGHEPASPRSPTSGRSDSPFPSATMPSVLQASSSSAAHYPPLRAMPQDASLFNHYPHLANPYAGLITKRSRGRRVPNKPEEMNNLGKSGKVYTCKVPGCGKCFKRSEHLKRHVRSIHTDDKPFLCSYPACNKRFSRHDNLNQHARVHTTGHNDLDDLFTRHPLSQLAPSPLYTNIKSEQM